MVIRRKGFTFLELLIALSLFAVGMLSILHIFPINRRYLTQSATLTAATFVAQDQLEIVHGTDYASLPVLPVYFEPKEQLGSGSQGDQLNAFKRQSAVTYIDANGGMSNVDLGLKKVQVTVYWTENSISRNMVVSTYVHQ